MSPVFVFGTGRCGSTYLQRLISMRTRCWIWGEHEGVLGPLLTGVLQFEHSAVLEKNVFQLADRTDAELISHMVNGSALSWLNRLDRAAVRREIRNAVDGLFRAGLPRGWTEWGFKEILYGLNNRYPEALLRIFPNSIALFSFREPRETLKSMVLAWTPELARDPVDFEALRTTYGERANRWVTMLKYFVELKNSLNGDRVVFVCAELLAGNEAAILDAVGLERRSDSLSALPVGRTNAGPADPPDPAAIKLMDEMFSDRERECKELYTQAVALCRNDLQI